MDKEALQVVVVSNREISSGGVVPAKRVYVGTLR